MSNLSNLDSYCMNSDPSEIKVCSKCGSPDVECLAWVNMNTGEVTSYETNHEESFCNNCAIEIDRVITLDEFQPD